jgi:hypothetical protein
MIQFNPDGSIKVPGNIARNTAVNLSKMQNERCIKFRKEVVNYRSPKKCAIYLALSQKIDDARFIETIYNEFSKKTEAATSLIRLSDKEYKVEIGTTFKRCTDCCNFVNELKGFLYDNMIEEKGSCTFERTYRKFSYEDYFD